MVRDSLCEHSVLERGLLDSMIIAGAWCIVLRSNGAVVKYCEPDGTEEGGFEKNAGHLPRADLIRAFRRVTTVLQKVVVVSENAPPLRERLAVYPENSERLESNRLWVGRSFRKK